MDDALLDEEAVYQVIGRALLSARLPPGTKLGEKRLADVFGLTRERIRKVLHRLGHERLIDVIPNRGAFVVDPSLDEARVVYEARRIVESGIVARLAECLGEAEHRRLRAHVEAEAAALRAGAKSESMRLSGAFHMVLAELTGNAYIVRQMQELVIRTTMLDAFFDPGLSWSCSCDEHQEIFRRLVHRDTAQAVRAMTTHLSSVETRFRPIRCEPVEVDLEAVLRDETARFRRETAELVGA
ncbi:GntR family transcriptional regulator [Siculibacillus lacustris]|uniref:GntR family transcriptional regulator n=1 Tax=Siculibacillus lacustris TaxID=1549641 RepID=A0A4Q9VSU7_9HYPH|nr:GntR family transcriptional regulator [Siculibacillus lacustris]TBW38965.1 GntR family transcriptional regulator [Siculibacillus lacustris]